MPVFKVIQRIEHNQKLYLPGGHAVPEKAISCGHGQEISVDTGGVIELTEKEAAALTNGQIEPVKKPPKA